MRESQAGVSSVTVNLCAMGNSSGRRTNMTVVERPTHRPEHAKHVCNMCGKPCPDTICEMCSDRVRAEALDRKKHEEKPYS